MVRKQNAPSRSDGDAHRPSAATIPVVAAHLSQPTDHIRCRYPPGSPEAHGERGGYRTRTRMRAQAGSGASRGGATACSSSSHDPALPCAIVDMVGAAGADAGARDVAAGDECALGRKGKEEAQASPAGPAAARGSLHRHRRQHVAARFGRPLRATPSVRRRLRARRAGVESEPEMRAAPVHCTGRTAGRSPPPREVQRPASSVGWENPLPRARLRSAHDASGAFPRRPPAPAPPASMRPSTRDAPAERTESPAIRLASRWLYARDDRRRRAVQANQASRGCLGRAGPAQARGGAIARGARRECPAVRPCHRHSPAGSRERQSAGREGGG